MSKKSSMTPKAASRIQSAADRSGRRSGFKARAASAAAKNAGGGGQPSKAAKGAKNSNSSKK